MSVQKTRLEIALLITFFLDDHQLSNAAKSKLSLTWTQWFWFMNVNVKQSASTAAKAPVSTASKAPVKPDASKTASKSKAPGGAESDKKKRKKTRKETYSSYIYKGWSTRFIMYLSSVLILLQCSSRCILTLVSPTRPWPSSTPLSMIFSSASPQRLPVCMIPTDYNNPSLLP